MHHEECNAPICAGDFNKNYKTEVLWYPGEPICGKTPYQKFQRVQKRINKLVAKQNFKYMDFYFTAESLEKKGRITSSTKGKNPEANLRG